jgi:hypothetical protein
MNLLPTGERANIDEAIDELLQGGFVYIISGKQVTRGFVRDLCFFSELIERNFCPEDLLQAAVDEDRYFALIDATEGEGYILTVAGEEPRVFKGPLDAFNAEAQGSSSNPTT